jgi:transcriptional regulator with XRE-family HTH domain
VAMHALGRLIADVMASQEWNQSEVGRRAGLSRSRISQLMGEPVKAVPTRATIISLARGLGLPPWVVMDAILESLGLPTRPTYVSVEEAVAADSSLDAKSKRAALAFVDHLRTAPRPDLANVQGIRLAEDPVEHTRADTRNGR